jgi:hypothetical protein
MTEREQNDRFVRAAEGAAPGTRYGLLLTGPMFPAAPAAGARIRMGCGDQGVLGWTYDPEGRHLVTAVKRHRVAIEVQLRHL